MQSGKEPKKKETECSYTSVVKSRCGSPKEGDRESVVRREGKRFYPKDDNLGQFMSTVCGCTCEGGQVWVHARRRGVGDRPDPAGGRLGVEWHHSGNHAE